jgi:putative two-component system response regulator
MLNSPDSGRQAGTDSTGTAMAVAAYAMAALAETRDSDSGKHMLRVQHYVQALAQRLTEHPRFAALLTAPFINTLFQLAPLYDMGTIGIADRILLKPSRLTPAELEIMRTHARLAHDAIEQSEKTMAIPPERLQTLKELAFSHHEKWDGSGYPQGLLADQIPLPARLMAMADVYDALISDRVYKAGIAHDQAVQVIFGERGAHFDPDLVDAFIEIQDEFQAIAQRFADTELDMQKKIEYMANAIAENADL